jgi:hypothetical protein
MEGRTEGRTQDSLTSVTLAAQCHPESGSFVPCFKVAPAVQHFAHTTKFMSSFVGLCLYIIFNASRIDNGMLYVFKEDYRMPVDSRTAKRPKTNLRIHFAVQWCSLTNDFPRIQQFLFILVHIYEHVKRFLPLALMWHGPIFLHS